MLLRNLLNIHFSETILNLQGSGCGAVGRVVAFGIRYPWL